MHIHGNTMNANTINPYFDAAEKAIAAQRAANVRKKLMKHAPDIGGVSNPDEAAMIGQWLSSGHNRALNDDEYHASAPGKKPAFG